MKVLVAQSTLCDPWSVHRILQARIVEWVTIPSFRGFSWPCPGIEPRSPALQVDSYSLSHQGSPRILEWVVYPFSRRTSQPRNRTRVSCIAGGFFTSWATLNLNLILRLSQEKKGKTQECKSVEVTADCSYRAIIPYRASIPAPPLSRYQHILLLVLLQSTSDY